MNDTQNVEQVVGVPELAQAHSEEIPQFLKRNTAKKQEGNSKEETKEEGVPVQP